MARLILMCGLPGAGKTTAARELAERLPAVRLCPDEWMAELDVDLFDEPFRERLERIFWTQAQELLALGQNVILESGFWLRSDRDEKRKGARALGAAVELRYLHAPLPELARRIRERATIAITEELLAEYATYFEPPDAAELKLFDPAG